MPKRLLCLCALLLGVLTAAADTPKKFAQLAAARVEKGYVAVQYADGKRGMFPFSNLSDDERAWLEQFATEHPLAKGRSSVVTARVEEKATILKHETVNGTETLRLCLPGKLRDQIGGTCMIYARAHLLDMAGYPVRDADIYRVTNVVPVTHPYLDYRYYMGMQLLYLQQKPGPFLYPVDQRMDPYEWARQQLRKGRPILAHVSREVWLTLPADFVADHPFIAGSKRIGHQVVVSGFDYNPTTGHSSFHIVNSWLVLPEFDVSLDKATSNLLGFEHAISPRGQPPEEAEKLVVQGLTPERPIGAGFVYTAATNLGPRRVVARDEESARSFLEAQNKPKDMETYYSDLIVRIYDYIVDEAEPEVREAAAAAFIGEIARVPPAVTLPHLDLELGTSNGKVYFVRLQPAKVVKLSAESTGDALEQARRLSAGKG